jgi:tetratricopeptide (TPR) repeat protein
LEYTKTDLLYSSSKFAEARAKAQGLITSLGDKVAPRMYKMMAYACDTLGDLACAKQNIDLYFQKQDTAAIIGGDYAERANISAKSPDTATKLTAIADYKLAIQRDTMPEFKAKYIASVTDLAKKLGNKQASADIAYLVYTTKKTPVNTDVYNWGMANYQAGNYKTADSIFCGIYVSKYPTEIYGYLWCARSKQAQDDSVGSQGIAVEAYDKLAQVARGLDSTAKAAGTADSTKYKAQIVSSYSFLATYYNNIKKDKATAIAYLEKILEVDPTNADAPRFIEILKRPAKQPAARPAAGAKSKSATGK